MTFVPDLSARAAHARLLAALETYQEAEQNAVLWFADVRARKLYEELSYSSMQQYAREALGFSEARYHQFQRLSERLAALPALRESLTRGEIPWTKAREVAAVATPDTAAAWVETARITSRRELRKRIDAIRTRRATARRRPVMRDQIPLTEIDVAPERLEIMAEVTLRFTPEELATFEAFLEQAMTRGEKGSREERMLALMAVGTERNADPPALEALETPQPQRRTRVHPSEPGADGQRPVPPSPYRIVVQACPRCADATVNTARGPLPISLSELDALSCDAVIERDGKNRATIPPRLRRRVLARDGYRCRIGGCGRSLFLNVHHTVHREHGGPNTLENLISICAACHRVLHRLGERRRALEMNAPLPEGQRRWDRRRVG